jgi:nucleolar protein 56
MSEEFTRRRALKTAALVGITATAGCLGDDDETAEDDDSEPSAESDAGTSGETDEGTPTEDNAEPTEQADGASDASVTIDHPEAVRIDNSFSVTVENVSADVVDVEVTLRDFHGVRWSTTATYELSGDTLEFDSAEPRDREFGPGTMTLVQRASPNTESVYFPHWGDGDEVSVTISSDGDTLASTTIDRHFGGVEVTETESDELVGNLIEPPGDEQVPGVIVLHGSGGRPLRGTAQMIAANGFAAIPLQYFDPTGEDDQLPGALTEVPLEYVEAAANYLLDHDRVLGPQVGVWGVSRGGELALLSGSQFDSIGPVVSVNGSGYVWAGISDSNTFPSAWSYGGEPLDYVPQTEHENWSMESPRELTPAFRASIEAASESALADATIPVEDIDGPVTLVSGGDDRLWNSQELHTVATNRLDDHGQEYTHLVYEDAGHLITYPYRPVANRTEDNEFVFGGTVDGYIEAGTDHWPHVIETFETLREQRLTVQR